MIEAVTNAVRHADAGHCRVDLARDRETLVIHVADDGRGIEPGPVGVGTRAMYERAAEVGGELLVGRGRDGGTVVSASLPIGAAERTQAADADGGGGTRVAEVVEAVEPMVGS